MTTEPDTPDDARVPFRALPRRRAYEQILLQIERAIAVGDLSPGDRLPGERELAETFGVSRASVREALRVLETLGVVVARRGNGAESGSVVTDRASVGLATALRFHTVLGQIPTLDFVDVRAALEGESAARAARLPTAPTERLRELIDAMSETDTILGYHELDTEFHYELARIGDNALLTLFMETVRHLVSQAMVRGLERLEDWREERGRLVAEHTEVVGRITARDPEGARTAVQGHILRFYREVFSDDPVLLEYPPVDGPLAE